MRLKLDENLPSSLVGELRNLGYDVDTAQSEGLAGKDDREVWDETQRAGRILVTQDLDFSDLRRFVPGSHCGIVLLRLGNPSRLELRRKLVGLLSVPSSEDWAGCFVVVTDLKLRIHKPT